MGSAPNWDDPWLVEHNAILASAGALRRIWTDLSVQTRLALGAEYLPVRDTIVHLELSVFGFGPQAMRLANVVLYGSAVLLLRGYLRRALGPSSWTELAVLVFAVHPVHVESVAWIACRKDVLELFFVVGALYAYAGNAHYRWLSVPCLLLLAHLSKVQSVVGVGLLMAHDVMVRRRPQTPVILLSLLMALGVGIAHLYVANEVHMVAEPAGGSRMHAAYSMGEVIFRYVGNLVVPASLSIAYDVPARSTLTFEGALGWSILLVWFGSGVWGWYRSRFQLEPPQRWRRLLLPAWLWFAVPLIPVSQIVVPIQNRMADRYLIFSVLGPALLLVGLPRALPKHLSLALGVLTVSALAILASARSNLFADSVALFADATVKTTENRVAPYQLGMAAESAGDIAMATEAYEEALRRNGTPDETVRRATNNLARLYARVGRSEDAARVLESARKMFPDDPKLLYNLSIVLARLGRLPEAHALRNELLRTHPEYSPGSKSTREFWHSSMFSGCMT